ncbi:hypothetical protein Tco_0119700, partial [Tanacetum coccineum]
MHANGFVYEYGNTKKVSEDEPFRSEDPFGIYDILNRNKDSRELSKEDDLSHPPGFTPRMDNGEEEHITDKGVNVEETNERVTSMPSNTNVGEQVTGEGLNTEENNKRAKSTSSFGHKTKKDWIKELCMKHRVNFVALQETKTESMDLVTIKLLWGNISFDYAFSPSVGNSGAVMGTWTPLSTVTPPKSRTTQRNGNIGVLLQGTKHKS